MGLVTYHSKRNFRKTPEPRGEIPKERSSRLRFVIQKHAARRLHYDFRLEMDGALKSWAVPKGPSLDPQDKRLAIQVEDHPLSYRSFEGIIPKGNYGGGTVLVWDEGTYLPEEGTKLSKDLERGRLNFVLKGKKLHGGFSLVRMHGRESKEWLLMKRSDSFASKSDVTENDESVKTGRTIKEIAEGVKGEKHIRISNRIKKVSQKSKQDQPHVMMPENPLTPMLATLIEAPFDKEGWVFEIKWDGYRAISELSKKGVSLYSRNHKSFDQKYPEIIEDLKKIKTPMVLDGEIVALDEMGRSSFQLLQNYNKTGKGNIAYFVFDILKLKEKDLTSLQLSERRTVLQKELPSLPRVKLSEAVKEKGIVFFEAAVKNGLEGIIAKNGKSSYQPGKRTEEWLKIKTHLRQEALICGYTEPKGSRKRFGALILGVYENAKLVYVGHTGTGFNSSILNDLHARMQPLVVQKCPFVPCPKPNAPVTWLTPKIICEVSFQSWTDDGLMRQPVFLGTREDKPSTQVKKEIAQPQPSLLHGAFEKQTKARGNKEIEFSNLNKLYWPKEKITKGDLINYYREVSPIILPYLKDRPESLHRHPDGIRKPGFFQKDTSDAPDWIKTLAIESDKGKQTRYLLCQDRETLLYMANLGCIEINPWSSRVGNLDCPDYMVMDLDPERIAFSKVVETALEVRRVLERAELESYCKTSGATGLHIYVPLGAQYDYDVVRQFAELVSNIVNQKIPTFTSVTRSPKERQRKVYLDYLQNRRAQTLAAPYSVRPRPNATVSTPLKWNEVDRKLNPETFTIRTILKRLEKLGDLFKPVLKSKSDLNAALKKLALH